MIDSASKNTNWHENCEKQAPHQDGGRRSREKVEKTVSLTFSQKVGKCSPLQERGATTNSRLYSKGVALCTDLEAGIIN